MKLNFKLIVKRFSKSGIHLFITKKTAVNRWNKLGFPGIFIVSNGDVPKLYAPPIWKSTVRVQNWHYVDYCRQAIVLYWGCYSCWNTLHECEHHVFFSFFHSGPCFIWSICELQMIIFNDMQMLQTSLFVAIFVSRMLLHSMQKSGTNDATVTSVHWWMWPFANYKHPIWCTVLIYCTIVISHC